MAGAYLVAFLTVVATDDEKIAECCRGFGAEVIMTSESCRNGKQSAFYFLNPFFLQLLEI